MKDAIFVGRDVAEALEVAARSLGLAPAALRYVVLEPGALAGPGRSSQPARIAVLLDGGAASAPAPSGPEPSDALRTLVMRLGEAAGVTLDLELEPHGELLVARLAGPGAELFLEDDGAALRALDHLLQRAFARRLAPRRLRLECEGFRAQRDARLEALAAELAAAVRGDGRPRSTGPLNAYERRLVHLALGEDPELRTFSVGAGAERSVTIARKDDPDPAAT